MSIEPLTESDERLAIEMAGKLEHAIVIWGAYLGTAGEWPELQRLVDEFTVKAKALRIYVALSAKEPGK